jgi:hypothetical protein
MTSRFIFSFLKISVSVLYYLLGAITVIILVTSILKLADGHKDKFWNINTNAFEFNVLAFDFKKADPPVYYAADSVVRYYDAKDRYKVEIAPASPMGYYVLFMKMVFLCLGIVILWHFKKIFKEIKLDQPFKFNITRRLKVLAALFIISDVLRILDYILFNAFLHRHITSPKFELLTDVGNGIITGFIIYIIAIIYERGTVLQDENALTV